jgi:hypothetical protein
MRNVAFPSPPAFAEANRYLTFTPSYHTPPLLIYG